MSETSASLLDRLKHAPDSVAWRRFSDIYTPFLYDWLRRHSLQDCDARDVLQEIFAVVARRIGSFEYDRDRGTFRSWLRTIAANCLGTFLRARKRRPIAGGGSDVVELLHALEDPASSASQIWDRQHDQFLVARFLELIESEFESGTWRAFRGVAIEGRAAADVAADVGMTRNAVYIAKSRVMSRLREEADGLMEFGDSRG